MSSSKLIDLYNPLFIYTYASQYSSYGWLLFLYLACDTSLRLSYLHGKKHKCYYVFVVIYLGAKLISESYAKRSHERKVDKITRQR
jgi:hypothetical protein